MLFQSGNLFEHLTLARERPSRAAGSAGRRRRSAAVACSTELGLAERATALADDRCRAARRPAPALAVALANDPAVVLADEPTGELDEATESRLLDLLRAGRTRGRAVVVVTPQPRPSPRRPTAVVLLVDGQLVA